VIDLQNCGREWFLLRGKLMKRSRILLVTLIVTLIVGCSQKLPENYGIYAYTNKGREALSGQKILFAGNLLQSITGLKGAASKGFDSISHFIIFEKDINPKSIGITQLVFKKGGYVQNIIGTTYVDVNLWVASKNIDFDIAPIEGKKDMYKLTPKEKLSSGFYALHFGGLANLSTIEASLGNTAFDFVIGNSNDYQGYEVLKKRNDDKIKAEAEQLLKSMNSYFNDKDYIKMKEIYRPNGRVLSESEWQEFTKGLNTWFHAAGKIVDSKINTENIIDNEGMFQIQTIYEKKGQQTERFVVRKIDGKYYITSLE
jgi:hypothetical protein